ncbi:hypothetical protein C8A00DRAFT_29637 [Chaetomidium leptoderma]|uniref:Carboxylesterase family protein n=1 Tax=Chaetomidium leptoderma TaxID=669021 RepID=A0AAN6VTG9_9PEZI|nr:hypothetical protein C8A00DRAFT_29637 [Chaetomidium leptoderma]
MAATSRSRPCVDLDNIHDDHSHKELPWGTSTSALGELALNKIHNTKPPRSSIESLARQLDSFHIHSSDKENKSRLAVETPSRVPSAALLSTGDVFCDNSHDSENSNPLALASQQLPSTKEQLSRHQEGQFEWLLSFLVKTAAQGRRPRGDSHGDAELFRDEKKLYFGCNLVHRRSQSGGALESDKPTNIYTLLATRIEGEDQFAIDMDAEVERMQSTSAGQLRLGDAQIAEHHYEGLDVPKSPGLAVDVNELAADLVSERSRPVSRIEDSVEALDKLEEEIEALSEVTRLERVRSSEAATRNIKSTSTKTTPLKRAASVRTGPSSTPGKAMERSSSVRKPTTSTGDDATSSARKVPRPASLLPPKAPAKSNKLPTVPAFELPGEAVARRLKEQREQRLSQHISSEQAAALAAAYSPSKPHFKSSKVPTRPTFELPGEAISRKKREEREARLRAQEEEERKRREFKARPIRGSLVPNSVPRETLASLARQKTRATEGSSDSVATTITSVSKKRQPVMAATFSSAPRPTAAATTSTTATTLPTRGRNNLTIATANLTSSPRATSTVSTSTTGSAHSRSAVSAEEAVQQKLRGKEVFARDNSYTAEREREKRERENAARVARERAAERSREMSRLWAEKQRVKREGEKRRAAV